MTPVPLTAADARYPARLRERLGDAAPDRLSTLGNLDLFALPNHYFKQAEFNPLLKE